MKRKIFSVLLSLVMTLAMMPAMAVISFAGETDTTVPVELVKAQTSGSKAVKLSWNKVSGATKYIVYGQRCGKKCKKIITVKGNTYTVKKISGKKLKAHQSYRFYVVAKKGGKVLAKSKTIHFITAKTKGKYANARSIAVKPTSLTLKPGETVKLKPTTKIYKNKKHIKKSHGAATRFVSSNPKVAKVNASGIVTAKKKGKATIYVQDIGGRWCKTAVTVKKSEPSAPAPTPAPAPDPAPAPTVFTVTFDMQDHGTQIAKINSVTSGSRISVPAAPTEEGFVFDGWYKEAGCTDAWNFDTDTITADTTLYAKWIEISAFTMLSGPTWFSMLTSGTDIEKDSITDIVFSKEIPAGTIAVDGVDLSENKTGTVKGYIVDNGGTCKIHVVGEYIFGNADCRAMFDKFSNLATLDFDNFDTSNVTNTGGMFNNCSRLASLDLSKFDTSKVTMMNMMFHGCSNLTSLDLSKFDTSNVTNTAEMFSGCTELTSLALGKFNTEKVTNARNMFLNCAKLSSVGIAPENEKIKGELGSTWTYGSGSYTAQAPAAPLTIKYILGTVSGGFPTSDEEKTAPAGAWRTDTGNACYVSANYIVFNNQSESGFFFSDISNTSVVEKTESEYCQFYDSVKIVFNIGGETLTSITFTGNDRYSGTYTYRQPR